MNKQRILIVDDLNYNRDVLSIVLSQDYDVDCVSNGQAAIDFMHRRQKPDLILLDIIMPGLDGFEVCKRLKADYRTRQTTVIFVTALGEVKDEAYGFEIGAVDYITKPFNPAIVRARVRTHLALYDQNIELQRQVDERTEELKRTQEIVIERLGRAAEYKDNETGKHVIRMSHYAWILARKAGMPKTDADQLKLAAPMHDIGKIKIPDELLQRKGPLDSQEMRLMRAHAQFGAEIIGDHDCDLLIMAKSIALSHHEKWDGSGYPNGLAGEEIPLVARIVAIADVFDALTSRRPYKNPWTTEDALRYIENKAGEHFDPTLAGLLRKCLPEILEVYNTYMDEASRDESHLSTLSLEEEENIFVRR